MPGRTLAIIFSSSIGLFFLISGLSSLISGSGTMAVTWMVLAKQSPEIALERALQFLLGCAGPVFSILAGAYLLFAGKRVVDLIVRKTVQADGNA